jgi:hypothetical protein
MSTPPPRTPAENVAILLRCLSQAVAAMGGGNRLTYLVIGLIVDRIRVINQGFRRLADRIAAGTYRPRRSSPRRTATGRKPRRQSPLPRHFGWLQPLLPEAVQFRAQLEHLLLRNPEMAALIAQAPASMARVLRPLCWMLRLDPPPILARPRPQPAAAPAPAAGPPASPSHPPPPLSPPPRSPPPRSPQPLSPPPPARRARRAPPMPRACGPPRPA